MTEKIISYIEFLKKNYGFNITFHEKSGIILKSATELLEYNIHSNPYCLCVKSERELWNVCVKKQCAVYKKAEERGSFYGSCYAGMEEFVFPVKSGGEMIGFVSVSGYCSDIKKAKEKISHLCDKYYLNKSELLKIYEENVSFKLPDEQLVKTLVSPLCAMLELVYIKNKEYVESEGLNMEANYIFAHVMRYLRKNYQSKISLEMLSSFCHCSKSYISHLFKKNTGKSILAYANELRINEAKKLLENTCLSVKEIAMRVGFNDSNYFTNSFKAATGVSPKKYRIDKKHIDKNAKM